MQFKEPRADNLILPIVILLLVWALAVITFEASTKANLCEISGYEYSTDHSACVGDDGMLFDPERLPVKK